MHTPAKITSFFQSLPKGTPLPFRWTPSADRPKKRKKLGRGRPRKIRLEPDISIRSEGAATTHSFRQDEELPQKTKRLYSTEQKQRVVGLANAKSVAAAVEHFKIPRTTINRWMIDGYFDDERVKGGNRKGQGRRLTYNKALDDGLLC